MAKAWEQVERQLATAIGAMMSLYDFSIDALPSVLQEKGIKAVWAKHGVSLGVLYTEYMKTFAEIRAYQYPLDKVAEAAMEPIVAWLAKYQEDHPDEQIQVDRRMTFRLTVMPFSEGGDQLLKIEAEARVSVVQGRQDSWRRQADKVEAATV